MSVSRPALRVALLKREAGPVLVVLVGLAVAGAFIAAREMTRADAVPFTMPVLRIRYDHLVLLVACVLLVLNVAQRVEADHSSGWVNPVFVLGGSRVGYGLVVAAAAAASATVVFAAAAAVLALAVHGLSGSTELVRSLGRTVGGGVLLLAVYALLATFVALLVRRAIATVCIVAVAVAVPYLIVLRQLLRNDVTSWWLYGLTEVAPPVVVPATASDALHALVQAAAGCVLVAVASQRRAGRCS